MSEYDGRKWVPAIVMVVVILTAAAVVVGLMFTGKPGVYAPKFDAEVVTDSQGGTMTKFHATSLYPYSGQWDTVVLGRTAAQCLETCVTDTTCRGFFHHNSLSAVDRKDSCYFYRNNNVRRMMGPNVEFSSYFEDLALVMGAQLPGSSTDVYVKDGQEFKMFRSVFAKTT